MKKWMLISTCDREIMMPDFFDTWEEAHMEMSKQVGDVIGMSKAEVKETYLNGVEIDGHTCVLEMSAWYDRHACNDWQIFYIEGKV